MHDQTFTFVLAGGDGQRLLPLTTDQPKPLVPFGAVFRLLDFTLNNVINSQLRHVYVLTQYKPERVHSYIREGWAQLSKEFRGDLGEDLTCMPPVSTFLQNLRVVEKSGAETVLIVSGDQIHQMDYRRLLRHHVESQADLTIGPKGIYVLRREAALQLVRKYAASGKDVSFEKTVVPAVIRSGRASHYNFSGYSHTISSLDDFHEASMDLVCGRTDFDAYSNPSRPTRPLWGTKQLQDSRYATNSRVALGARLAACRVSNSVISAGVRVESGAEVENTVVLPGCHIGAGARIRNSILSENAVIPPNAEIGFDPDQDRQRYSVTVAGIPVIYATHREESPNIHRRCARVATKAHFASAR